VNAFYFGKLFKNLVNLVFCYVFLLKVALLLNFINKINHKNSIMTYSRTLLNALALVLLLSLIQCKTIKTKQQSQPTITIENATYLDWVGGQPGVLGTRVQFAIKEQGIKPDSLYFHKRVVKIDIKQTNKGAIWVANYTKETAPDRQMCIATEDEYGNKAPLMQKFPFDLKEDEAMLSYFVENKKYYYKISPIAKGETVSYP